VTDAASLQKVRDYKQQKKVEVKAQAKAQAKAPSKARTATV